MGPDTFWHNVFLLHIIVSLSPLTQISGTSYSTESEQAFLLSRYDQLKAVAAVLTPAHERLLKAIDTRNLSDFVYVIMLVIQSVEA